MEKIKRTWSVGGVAYESYALAVAARKEQASKGLRDALIVVIGGSTDWEGADYANPGEIADAILAAFTVKPKRVAK